MRLGRFAVRTIVGGLFVGHGTQKLFGSFGGGGLDKTSAGFQSLGLRPGRRNATAAGLSETVGGALLAAGLFTPLAAASLIGTMITAIRTVHWKNGVWASNGGYEYNLVLIATIAALVEAGTGPLSLDHLRGHDEHGVRWALAVLAAGAVSSAAVVALARRTPAVPAATTETTAEPLSAAA
jgi:putative oxidoreductase